MFFHQVENSEGNYAYNARIYKNIKINYHFHKNFEVFYVISGKVKCVVNNKTDVLESGEWGICLSNEVHAFWSEEDSIIWIGVFSGDFVHAFEKQVQSKKGNQFKFRCTEEIEEYLRRVLVKESRPSIYMLKSCLYAVCAEFIRCVELTEHSEKNELLMRDIVKYVTNHFQNKVELVEIAEALGYDYYYISKCFRKNFNMSFTDFMNSYRIGHALMLLSESDKSITEIAYESGFQSIRNFNHSFKNHVGMTPRQYRERDV